MSTIIQIKRSSGTSAPATLKLGELAYTYGTGTQGNLVDSNKAIDEIFIGNSSSTGGTLKLNEGTNNGTNFIGLKAPNSVTTSTTFTLPSADGSADQFIKTDGSGNLSFAAIPSGSFTIEDDNSTQDTFTTGQVLKFAGGTGLTSAVTDNTVTFNIDSTVATLTGSQTLTNKTLTSPVISTISNTGTLTLPTSTDTLVGRATTDTLTNKTITSPTITGTGSIAGTFTGNITGDVTGNADTATALETARNIAGQSFDGTSDITIAATDLSDTDQSLATTDTVTFNDLTVSGNLTVSGTTTTVNTETINLADNTITLNSNATGSATEDGGIEIERGDDANKTLIWDESTDKWTVGSETFVAATFEGTATGLATSFT